MVNLSAYLGRLWAISDVKRCVGLAGSTLVVILVALGLFGPIHADHHETVSNGGDLGLYTRVIDKVRAGQPYDQVVIKELRDAGGKVRPFVTIRPPLLATALAVLPDPAARILSVRLLAIGVLGAWFLRLGASAQDQRYRWPLLLAMASGEIMAFAPQAYLMHETWAALLIALSLAWRQRERWLASVAVATVAALVRELAAPYLLIMLVLALVDRRPKEALGWLAGFVLFAAALARHAAVVDAMFIPSDPAMPGWLKVGGWPFVLHAMSWNIVALFLPYRVIGGLFPLALLGLATWRGELARRVALTVGGYVVAFLFVGRAGNFYWGLLIAPLWPMGLAMAPAGVSRIWSWLGLGGAASANPRTMAEAGGAVPARPQ